MTNNDDSRLCKICGSLLTATDPKVLMCGESCKEISRRISKKLWKLNNPIQKIESDNRYNSSVKGKLVRKTYLKSAKGQIAKSKQIRIKRELRQSRRGICQTCGTKFNICKDNREYCGDCSKDIHNYNHQWKIKNPIHYKLSKKRSNAKLENKIKQKMYAHTEIGKSFKRMSVIKRRAKLKKIIHNFTNQEWFDKLEETQGYCPRCHDYVGINQLSLDHIHPVSRAEEGRIYTINDIQPLCKKCNCIKGTQIMVET